MYVYCIFIVYNSLFILLITNYLGYHGGKTISQRRSRALVRFMETASRVWSPQAHWLPEQTFPRLIYPRYITTYFLLPTTPNHSPLTITIVAGLRPSVGDHRTLPCSPLRQSGTHGVAVSDSAGWWRDEQGMFVQHSTKEDPRAVKKLHQIAPINSRYLSHLFSLSPPSPFSLL